MLAYSVVSCQELPSHVWRVQLQAVGDSIQAYAGQYVFLSTSADATGLPFSLANFSKDYNTVELHIRDQQDPVLKKIIAALLQSKTVFLSNSTGVCAYKDISSDMQNIVLAVGGTGFAMAQSILQAAAQAKNSRTWHLLFCATTNKGLYFLDSLVPIKQAINVRVKLITQENKLDIETQLCNSLATLAHENTHIAAAGPYGFIKKIYINTNKLGYTLTTDIPVSE
jgi:NAD(P)H-flavin reductase